MDLAAGTALSNIARCFRPSSSLRPRLYPVNHFVSRILTCAYANSRRHSLICHRKGRGSYTKSSPKELTLKEHEEAEATEEDVEEVEKELEDEEADYVEDFLDDMLANDETDFEDEFQDDNEDADPQVGDGGGGGGISLAGTCWDKEALTIAADVSLSFNGDLRIYAFKTSANSTIRLRIEKLSNKYGSPTMDDIEAFSSAYRLRLDEAEGAGTIPKDISLEGYSGLKPGWTRVSFAYYITKEEFSFILDAIELIASYGYRFLSIYQFDWVTGDWKFLKLTFKYHFNREEIFMEANNGFHCFQLAKKQNK